MSLNASIAGVPCPPWLRFGLPQLFFLADPDSAFDLDADLDTAFHTDADRASQNHVDPHADPDPQHWLNQHFIHYKVRYGTSINIVLTRT